MINVLYKRFTIRSQTNKFNKNKLVFVIWDNKSTGLYGNGRVLQPRICQSLKAAKVWIDNNPNGVIVGTYVLMRNEELYKQTISDIENSENVNKVYVLKFIEKYLIIPLTLRNIESIWKILAKVDDDLSTELFIFRDYNVEKDKYVMQIYEMYKKITSETPIKCTDKTNNLYNRIRETLTLARKYVMNERYEVK